MAPLPKLLLFSLSVAAVIIAILFDSSRYVGLLPFSWLRPPIHADLVVLNATIFTSDDSLPFAQAMAVRDGRILRVGDDSAVKGLMGPETQALNLNGNVVLPGFIDSHVHMIPGGIQMGQVQLRGVNSKDEFVRKVKNALKDKVHGEWILGGGWNNDLWGGELPTASWIDDITTDNPVWLSRMDGHMGLANSYALKIAGITKTSLNPVGGTIVKSIEGEPSGLLIDSAMKLVFDVIPDVSVQERRSALMRASKHALMRGVTTVVDVGRYVPGASVDNVWQDFSEVYEWADSAGEMMVRVCMFFPMETLSKLADLIDEKGKQLSQWVHFGGVKAFADGSLGSNSALFYEPYEDDLHNFGLQVTDFDWLRNATLDSDNAGIQVAIHAIGDRANDMVLDMFNSVVSSNGIRDRRFRIEHAQHLTLGSVARFGQQQIIASVQPEHLLDDADSAVKKLGILRAEKGPYMFQSLSSNGAKLAFGSDWPVADINPLGGINAALLRVPTGRENAWIPSERMSLKDALRAYTISAAYACFLDEDLGSLSVGKYADFVVLPVTWDQFEWSVPSYVLATYVGGKKAYP